MRTTLAGKRINAIEIIDGEAGHYISTVRSSPETLDVSILPGLMMDFSSIW
jgi:hypothetical protein